MVTDDNRTLLQLYQHGQEGSRKIIQFNVLYSLLKSHENVT